MRGYGYIAIVMILTLSCSGGVYGDMLPRPDSRNLLEKPVKGIPDKEADDYTVHYSLKQVLPEKKEQPSGYSVFSADDGDDAETEAEIAVNILGPNFIPVRTYLLRKADKLENATTLWDGRDIYGNEVPDGIYYASLSIIYPGGGKETRIFRFMKGQE